LRIDEAIGYNGIAFSESFQGKRVSGTTTKADLVDAVYEKVGGFSKREAADVVNRVFDILKDRLAEGEKVKISGFGNFVVRFKHARPGRNPQTGDEITIDARHVLRFRASQVLKAHLNSQR
jgi:integration host factor subunit alpha